ncbi:hypothetical protein A3Q56_05385 [Intoshia linei]|uniref:PRELI/MSF1 domain-containing protein n=1 Tax=Intoshia linei TaxID=1819745 RepID=A0A177AXQ0_9BILA|nr:hypothetical protein A3Q56_05385 [Intoshia linei]
MRIWASDHVFDHPWETVMEAAVKKYPNPLCQHVIAVDTIDHKIKNDKLHLNKLITLTWNIPSWIQNILSTPSVAYAHENSIVDKTNKAYTLYSKNLTFMPWLCIIEKMHYVPHPDHSTTKTILHQESSVSINGFPIVSSACENWIAKTARSNTEKGKQSIEWVISELSLGKEKTMSNADL